MSEVGMKLSFLLAERIRTFLRIFTFLNVEGIPVMWVGTYGFRKS